MSFCSTLHLAQNILRDTALDKFSSLALHIDE
jgi:hypothetical protein